LAKQLHPLAFPLPLVGKNSREKPALKKKAPCGASKSAMVFGQYRDQIYARIFCPARAGNARKMLL
jgi:hypothetical protein